MERQMTLYRIETPAYFSARMGEEVGPNSFLVNGDAARDLHLVQIANQGCSEFSVTELSAADYRAEAFARLGR